MLVHALIVLLLLSRKTEIADRLAVDRKKPQVVVMPFAREEEMFAVEMDSSDIFKETDHFRGILESFAHDNPRGEGGVLDETGPPLLSILDTMILTSIIEENQSHVLVAFCEKGVLIYSGWLCTSHFGQLLI